MKKNKMMRLASVLLVVTLLTTSIISGTFAKYVTTGDITESARVAKFGVAINASGTLFSNTYYAVGDGNSTSGTTVTVNSTGGVSDKVVAPGTTNTGTLSFGITGTPEVRVKVNISMEETSRIFLAANTYTDVTGAGASFTLNSAYYPIVWSLTKGGSPVSDSTGALTNVELSRINAYLNGLTLEFAPGTDLSQAAELSGYVLTWKWDYTGGTAVTTAPPINTNDQADTLLGDLAAGGDFLTNIKKVGAGGGSTPDTTLTAGTDYQLTETVKVTVTVEQVD